MGKHWTTFLYYYPRDVTEVSQLLWIIRCFYSAVLYFMSFFLLFVLYFFYYFVLILYVGDQIVAIIRKSIYLVLEAKF